MIDHIGNRQKIIKLLEQELFGPAPTGEELNCSLPLVFNTTESAYGPFKEQITGEEIINRDSPSRRYGIGVLFPAGTQEPIVDEEAGRREENLADNEGNLGPEIETRGIDQVEEMLSSIKQDENPSDYDLSLANSYKQSSIGISFLAEIKSNSILEISLSAGRYSPLSVVVNGKDKVWWLRKPVTQLTRVPANQLASKSRAIIKPTELEGTNTEDLKLRFVILSRSYNHSETLRLITISMVNRTDDPELSQEEKSIFQTRFKARVVSPESEWNIIHYPGRTNPKESSDNEERSLSLLYRLHPTFCTGHGCAGDWDDDATSERARTVIAEPLPKFEVPSVTPEILDDAGEPVRIPIAPLAGLDAKDNGFQSLENLIVMYEKWIETKKGQIVDLPIDLQNTAKTHLEDCGKCANRMRSGLEFIKVNEPAALAFQLANRAILYQQNRPKEKRKVFYNKKSMRIEFEDQNSNEKIGKENISEWRAFQIAFLLMALESTAHGNSPEREMVELIWFPTGGGKTEAYLGLAAFSIFLRRLENPVDSGVTVLMRYTLRLLTSQQFLRASKLVLAMEAIRREYPEELGERTFSIGMWLGAANTPNWRKDAIKIFNDLEKGNGSVENKFVLDRCPWCGAEMGPVRYKGKSTGFSPKLLGYQKLENTIKFHCPDPKCLFSSHLPIYVIDEDVFSEKPSIVIGTVDKFATLAWNPSARALFGISENGKREISPPSLIIQDELHLISGPLGSMVGLYEVLVEELSTDRRNGQAIKPKIVSSTATIRRYREQILALYGRQNVMLFPPPGLEAADSFFATYAKRNKPASPGRLYIGIHAPGLGSLQTAQVRTFTSLIHAPMHLAEEERDPWWTLLVFFNSLRELGTTLSLLQADIPDYTKVLVNRYPNHENLWRGVWEVKELTGRAKSEDIPKAISELELTYPGKESRPIDVCLASSILEVGIDIDRLSLMAVVGQPKTTSQYIQVTGRVGRSWWERPGLVVTLYSATKPRDRSHFEKFRSYHERLYEQVEPASVTPFSPPALERALHAVLVSYVRQIGDQLIANSPYPFPEKLIRDIKEILIPRIRKIDALELENFERVFSRLSQEWKSWQMVKWEQSSNSDDLPLLRRAGVYVPPNQRGVSWETPTSLRNVDAECIAEISNPLPIEDGDRAK